MNKSLKGFWQKKKRDSVLFNVLFCKGSLNNIYKANFESSFPFYLQMTSPTALGVSPPRYSASMFQPWRRTLPTCFGPSFELCGSQTLAPRKMNRGLSSTRCVNWPLVSTVSRTQGVMCSISLWRPIAKSLCRSARKMKTFILGCPTPSLLFFKPWSLFHVLTVKWILH